MHFANRGPDPDRLGQPSPIRKAEPRSPGPGRWLAIAVGLGVVAVLSAAILEFNGAGSSAEAGAAAAAGSSPSAAPLAIAGASNAATPSSSPAASVVQTPSSVPAVSLPATGRAAAFPLALVARDTDLRVGYTSAQVGSLLRAGRIVLPCGLSGLAIKGADAGIPTKDCTRADRIAAALATKGGLALLPAGLVDPRVKVLTVDGADLFGNTVIRSLPYPLAGRSDALPAEMAGAAVAYDPADVRTVVSTGDTCPDRSVSLWAVVRGKGWDWTLKGGTARYTGTYMDTRYSGPTGNGWPVVTAVRTGRDTGAVWAMIHDADLAVNDFECPLVTGFTQHNSGTYFTIDPKVAGLMERAGMDVLSLASNHITDLGTRGVQETVDYLDRAGVAHAGAGKDLAAAMAPAVVDVRGLRFAILSWDATNTSTAATASRAGALRPTVANVTKAVAQARKAADIVIAMPQWNWPEYSAPFSPTALRQRDAWFAAGVDHILGSGTHWASAISVTRPDPSRGWRVAVTSHGNFLFGQGWSRQTQEGVIYESTFRGTELVQVRLHPYIVMDGAQPNLTDPTTDGAYVQRQVVKVSDLP